MKGLAAALASTALVLATACGSGEEAGMEETDQMAPVEEREPSSETLMEGADSVAADSMRADTMMEEGMPAAMLEESETGGT